MAKPPSQFRQMLERSVKSIQRQTAAVVAMEPTSIYPPQHIYSFTSTQPPVEPIYNIATGSDVDIGGASTCHLTPVPIASSSSSSASIEQSHLAFHGTMSLKFPPAMQGRLSGAYAAFRNKARRMLIGEDMWNLQGYTHLRIVVGYRGWDGWRSRWSCNVQTDSLIKTDLWQHRLDIPPSSTSTPSADELDPLSGPSPTFTTLHLPLSSFVLTNAGETAEDQVPIDLEKIRTIGFGLLGAGRGTDGMPLLGRPPEQISRIATEEEERLMVGEEGLKYLASGSVDAMIDSRRGRKPEVSREVPIAASKYHRVSSHRQSTAAPIGEKDEVEIRTSVEVRPDSEGYYELCLKSVEAVKWDPANDELEDLD
ncbi:complex I intermediate-associated protein 30-domain-containing protein [Naematelia encephala]|uniref:Complex I intermediate-associated protein 30-domain-containing protein n=1 Tax=Naematelia encephala TaxID=71784 RepID=A0A1Y2B494_9TREE|nr:complex I intermediate-associated protein 30-domain-containing protein [Naematelia encephala]